MDPHIQWMRRFLLSRAAVRVTLEAIAVGAAAGAGAFTLDPSIPVVVVLGLLVAQVVFGLRFAVAVLGNPINHRYLMAWSNPAGRVRPSTDRCPQHHEIATTLTENGFEHVLRLEDVGPDPAARSDEPGVGDGEAPAGIDVFQATSGLVVVGVADDGELTVLSRLADGRLVVTSPGFVPPHTGVIVGRHRRAEPIELITTHVERLEALHLTGADPVRCGPSLILDQMRAEWQAWQELGPFIGPLVVTGEGRRNPLLLQFSIPDQLVWDRSRSTGRAPVPGEPEPMPTSPPPSATPPTGRTATGSPAPARRNWFDPPDGPPASRNRRRIERS